MDVFKESDTVELKKSLSQLESSLKTICAFLNHKGGTVYFGVRNDGFIIGQPSSDSNLRKISQQISSRIKPHVVPSIEVIDVNGKEVIKVSVSPLNKNLYYFDGIPYKRSGTETVVMSPDEVKHKISLSLKYSWDKEICFETSSKDIDFKK